MSCLVHFENCRTRGATIIDDLEIQDIDIISDSSRSGEMLLMLAEFKTLVNEYPKELAISPVRSLAEIIEFNKK